MSTHVSTNQTRPIEHGDVLRVSDAPEVVPASTRLASLIVVVVPFAAFIVAIFWLWGWGVSWSPLVMLGILGVLTTLGVTVGFHRLLTHQSFQTTRPVKAILMALGSMTAEGPAVKWAAVHRLHHQHSDDAHDPHSPHSEGEGLMGLLRGLWHAHAGWLFEADRPGLTRYVPDLMADRQVQLHSRLFGFWVLVGLLIPTVVVGLITMSWVGALQGLIWGGLLRIFLVHHLTWSINSICHLWGSRPFQTRDHSRNNPIFGVLGLGEGWHNNHHAFPTSARHGLRWWEIDVSFMVIRGLAWARLAWKVRLPAPETMAAKRRRDPARGAQGHPITRHGMAPAPRSALSPAVWPRNAASAAGQCDGNSGET